MIFEIFNSRNRVAKFGYFFKLIDGGKHPASHRKQAGLKKLADWAKTNREKFTGSNRTKVRVPRA